MIDNFLVGVRIKRNVSFAESLLKMYLFVFFFFRIEISIVFDRANLFVSREYCACQDRKLAVSTSMYIVA